MNWLTNRWRLRRGGFQTNSPVLRLCVTETHDTWPTTLTLTYLDVHTKGTFHLHVPERLNWAAKEACKRSFSGQAQRFPFCVWQRCKCESKFLYRTMQRPPFQLLSLFCWVSCQWRAGLCGARSVNSSCWTFCYSHSQHIGLGLFHVGESVMVTFFSRVAKFTEWVIDLVFFSVTRTGPWLAKRQSVVNSCVQTAL